MPLTPLQRQHLIKEANKIKLTTLLSYIQAGEITLDDIPDLSVERIEFIKDKLKNAPNPQEQKEWDEIAPLLANHESELLLAKLNAYVNKWSVGNPAQNHIEEAKSHIQLCKDALATIQLAKEASDWEEVDLLNKASLITYLQKYPTTAHYNDIDDSFWAITQKDDVTEINAYKTNFPQGAHVNEADALLKELAKWMEVKNSGDIFSAFQYKKDYPLTPFRNELDLLILQLTEKEIRSMKEEPNAYERARLLKLIDDGIITEETLYSRAVLTKNVLATLRNFSDDDLPNIMSAIETSVAECPANHTDVYLFGVPATGKTCILMGLSRAGLLRINLASGGGDYAAALQQYIDAGRTVPRTPGNFVTTLDATIKDKELKSNHYVNLVEMSGEEFAFSIANNPNREFSFEDMGTGATELLKNNNRKVFFLIIDPTIDVVRTNREVIDGYNEEDGTPIKHLEYCTANQRTILTKMVNILQRPENREIMKRVDAVHIIMTKSDMLDSFGNREEVALDRFKAKYSDIVDILVELAQEYNFNVGTKFRPCLYTFSLGSFYAGGVYEFNDTDANKIVRAIKSSTFAVKDTTWWGKVRDKVN